MITAVVSFWFNVIVPFGGFALVCLFLCGLFLSKDLKYEARIHSRAGLSWKRELWFALAVVLDRVIIGIVFLCEFWARHLGTLREFLVGLNDLSVEAPQQASSAQNGRLGFGSTSMLNQAFRLVSTATRVSSRVQGNVVREVASEMIGMVTQSSSSSSAASSSSASSSASQAAHSPIQALLSLTTGMGVAKAAGSAAARRSPTPPLPPAPPGIAPWDQNDDDDEEEEKEEKEDAAAEAEKEQQRQEDLGVDAVADSPSDFLDKVLLGERERLGK